MKGNDIHAHACAHTGVKQSELENDRQSLIAEASYLDMVKMTITLIN